jgi:hypothetical protein
MLTRREVLRRISLGAMMSIGAPWAMNRALAVSPSLRGSCGRELIPTQGGARAPCLDQPPRVNPRADYVPAVADPWTGSKIVIDSIVSFAAINPEIAPFAIVIGGLLSWLWPQSSPTPGQTADDIWKLIKDKVQALIDQSISTAFNDLYQSLAKNEIASLKDLIYGLDGYQMHVRNLTRYLAQPVSDPARAANIEAEQRDIQRRANDVQKFMETNLRTFGGLNSTVPAWTMLPFYVQATNLYFGVLHDVLLHGDQYGFAATDLNTFLGLWQAALKQDTKNPDLAFDCYAYASTTLQAALDGFEQDYQARRSTSFAEWYPADFDDNYHKAHAALKCLQWSDKNVQNDKNSQLTITVADFLHIWAKYPLDPLNVPVPLPPVVLDRVLWSGPHGVPEGHDIGFFWEEHNNGHNDYVQVPVVPFPSGHSFPDVPPPPAVPDGHLTGISIDFTFNAGYEWRAINTCTNYHGGDQPILNGVDFKIAFPVSNPIVKVVLHACDFAYAGNFCTAGLFVAALGFVFADNSQSVAGNSYQTIVPAGWGIYDNFTVEKYFDGHALCFIDVTSRLSGLWTNDGDANLQSAGSLRLAFRLVDPTLKPSFQQLANLYVTSASALTVEQIAALVHHIYRSKGQELSEAEAASMQKEIADHIARERLDLRREEFWNRNTAMTY